MQNEDYNWYLSNFRELSELYGNSFISIKNKTVIGVFDSYASAVAETSKTEEIGTFIVQQCGKTEAAYTNYISSFNFI